MQAQRGFGDVFEIPRVGLSGNLALGWNPRWEISIIQSNQFFIHTDIKKFFGGSVLHHFYLWSSYFVRTKTDLGGDGIACKPGSPEMAMHR